MTDETTALPQPPKPPDRMKRLYGFFIHLVGHDSCAGYAIATVNGITSITCLACGVTSPNPHDVKEKYCATCFGFHDAGGAPDTLAPRWTKAEAP